MDSYQGFSSDFCVGDYIIHFILLIFALKLFVVEVAFNKRNFLPLKWSTIYNENILQSV